MVLMLATGCELFADDDCGDGRLDIDEECDGSADCNSQCERIVPRLTVKWVWTDVDNATLTHPDGYTRVEVARQAIDDEGLPISQLGTSTHDFDESSTTFDIGRLFGSYQLTYSLLKDPSCAACDAVYGTSPPVVVVLEAANTVTLELFDDQGFLDVEWELRGAITNNLLSCTQTGITTIRLGALGNTVDLPCVAVSHQLGLFPSGAQELEVTALAAGNVVDTQLVAVTVPGRCAVGPVTVQFMVEGL